MKSKNEKKKKLEQDERINLNIIGRLTFNDLLAPELF